MIRCVCRLLGVLLATGSLLLASASELAAQPTVPGITHSSSASDSAPSSQSVWWGLSAFAAAPNTSEIAATYPYATMCLMAALREEGLVARAAAAQRAQFIVRSDTIPLAPQAVHTARACSARWTLENTPTFELPGLLRTLLLAEQDSLAAAVTARWLQRVLVRDTVARAERLLWAMQLEMGIRPRTVPRLRLMQHELAALRALGPTAIEQQIDALSVIRQFAGAVGDLSWNFASADTLRQMVVHIPAPTVRELFRDELTDAYFTWLNIFNFPADFASPQFRTSVTRGLIQYKHDLASVDVSHESRESIPSVYDSLVVDNTYQHPPDSSAVRYYVNRVRPLAVQHWFHRPDTMTTYPRLGVPTVIVLFDPTSSTLDREIASYRRLYAEFAPKGVDFIVLTQTKGFFGKSTRLPIAAEVDSERAFFLDHLKLPGILGIVETRLKKLPDGRVQEIQDAGGIYSGSVTRDGMVWPGGGDASSEAEQEAWMWAWMTNHMVPAAVHRR